ncbi:MAG: hypothetical protein KDA58_10100 [Planctomycetaceae bacterium]|nr:hypothetical protein [Planctomycetaceae bacterium]
MTVRRTAMGLALGLMLTSGCHSLHTCVSEQIIACRNHEEAKMAWWSCEEYYYDCEPHLHDFGLGFQAGYQAIANGGDGCPPTMPPQKYWGVCYQSCEGREKVVSWYNGYSHGVSVALQDGVQNRNQIVTAMELYPRCQTVTEVTLPGADQPGTGSLIAPQPDAQLEPPQPLTPVEPEGPALVPPAY